MLPPDFDARGQDYIFALPLFDSFTLYGQLKFVGNQRITRIKLSALMFSDVSVLVYSWFFATRISEIHLNLMYVDYAHSMYSLNCRAKRWGMGSGKGHCLGAPFLSLLLSSPSLLLSLPFPFPLSSPPSAPSPFLPFLRSRPLKSSKRVWESAVSWVCSGAPDEIAFGAFLAFIIWHLVATNLLIFLRIK